MKDELLNVADYERSARESLPRDVLDYFAGGALDEFTLRENTAGWERLKLYYRVLAGVGERDLNATVLGQKISMPKRFEDGRRTLRIGANKNRGNRRFA